jgi:hypothetical protein
MCGAQDMKLWAAAAPVKSMFWIDRIGAPDAVSGVLVACNSQIGTV